MKLNAITVIWRWGEALVTSGPAFAKSSDARTSTVVSRSPSRLSTTIAQSSGRRDTMWSMTDSMAQATRAGVPLDVPRWRNAVGWASAVALAFVFMFSGLWKITDAQGAAVRMAQALVPESISLAVALGFGIV